MHTKEKKACAVTASQYSTGFFLRGNLRPRAACATPVLNADKTHQVNHRPTVRISSARMIVATMCMQPNEQRFSREGADVFPVTF